jgi:hypothetical protein
LNSVSGPALRDKGLAAFGVSAALRRGRAPRARSSGEADRLLARTK